MSFAARYLGCLLLFGVTASLSRAQPALTGVNLAGAEFGDGSLPGQYGVDYTYPTPEEIDYFTELGMKVFRLPFRWERLQIAAYADFDTVELRRLDAFVDYANASGAKVVLDPHNYARYYGNVIGSAQLPVEAFRDFWSRLATHYAANDSVIFGLMNEPNSMPTELWFSDANEAIDAIRATGATNLILVPGNAWTGAHSWYQNWYGTPNATVMRQVIDPLNNYAIDLHQYLDADYSGTSPTCRSTTAGSENLVAATGWLRQQGVMGFLGEIGAADNPTCLQALDDMLDFVDANADAWLGWTYWAAGPWWGNYMYSIEPDANGNDRPQTAVLLEHIGQPATPEPISSGDDVTALDIWPNPTRGATTLRYALSRSSPVEVSIFDLLGRQVLKLDEGVRQAGTYSLSLQTEGLVPGTYVVRLRGGTGLRTQMITVIR